MTSIVPQQPNGGKGKSRLSQQQEQLISQVIDEFYLTSQKLSSAKVIEEVRKQCFEKQIDLPSEVTIRRRIGSLTASQLHKRRARNTSIEPIIGSFPQVDYPLDIVQIDHTLVDLIIVDPVERLS